jgi:hypothetical protein
MATDEEPAEKVAKVLEVLRGLAQSLVLQRPNTTRCGRCSVSR